MLEILIKDILFSEYFARPGLWKKKKVQKVKVLISLREFKNQVWRNCPLMDE